MKEKIKIIVIIVIFIAVLLLVKVASNKLEKTLDEVEMTANTIVEEKQSNSTTSVIASFSEGNPSILSTNVDEEKTGEVLEVTEETSDDEVLNSSKRILIEFYADWCEPCKTLQPTLEEVAKENLDLKVVKINVDENPDLATVFGVNYVPLLVVMENAEEVNHAMGALSKKEILELIK